MTQSLKERYEAKRLNELREHVKKIDTDMLNEQYLLLMLEAMNQDDLDSVTAIVEKLTKIKDAAPTMKRLCNTIDQMIADVNKYTGGGSLAKVWNKLKEKLGGKNPIVQVTALANVLEAGFKQIPQILKNNGLSKDDLKGADASSTTLLQAIQRKAIDATKAKKPNANEAQVQSPLATKQPAPDITPDDPRDIKASKGQASKLQKSVMQQLRKALTPAGAFGSVKFMSGLDASALADELMNVPIAELIAVAGIVKQMPAPPQPKNQQEQPAKDKGTSGTTPATVGSGEQATAPTGTAGRGEEHGVERGKAPSGTKQRAPEKGVIETLANTNGVDPKIMTKLINTLHKSGAINVEKFNTLGGSTAGVARDQTGMSDGMIRSGKHLHS